MTSPSRSHADVETPSRDAEVDRLRAALAHAERDLAAAREREVAAEQRAVRLSQASATMTRTLESLCTTDDLETLLGRTLRSIAQQAGVRSGTAWLLDDDLMLHLMWVLDDDRLVRGRDAQHPNAGRPAPHRSSHIDWTRTLSEADPALILTTVSADPSMTDEQRTFLIGLGIKAMINVPMVIDGQMVGVFALRIANEPLPTSEDLEAMQALASQGGLAMRFIRLANDARAEAVAREREAAAELRATELAQANTALRRTIETLRTTEHLEALIGHTLRSIADQAGVRGATAWLVEPGMAEHLVWVLVDGRLVRGPESNHPNANEPMRRQPGSHSLWHSSDPPCPTILRIDDDRDTTDEQREHLRRLGVVAQLSVPMVVDGQLVGWFALHIGSDALPDRSKLELIQAIADQTALAIWTARLADEARGTVIAVQAEHAARLRAESQARLSQASRRTLERLAASSDPGAFVGHVLGVAVEQFGAVGGSVWRSIEGRWVRMVIEYQDGELRTSTDTEYAGGPDERAIEAGFLLRGDSHVVVDDADAIATLRLYDPWRKDLERRGIRTVVSIPMLLGDSYRGVITMWFRGDRRLTPDEIDLAHTFGNQAVLALELRRLSHAARMAAVNEERNRLAREIHDTIAQGLAAIVRQLESALSAAGAPASSPHIATAIEIARDNLVEARRSIRAMRPPILDGRTLDGALRDLVNRSKQLSSEQIRFQVTGRAAAIPSEVEDELLRIVNEALTNAIKHAAACTIDVDLLFEDDSVRIVVRDDGAGFDPARTPHDGVGLRSMHERAQRVGATVTLASEPGSGTEVLAYWARSGTGAP
jgi:signal transduction histidine kinase